MLPGLGKPVVVGGHAQSIICRLCAAGTPAAADVGDLHRFQQLWTPPAAQLVDVQVRWGIGLVGLPTAADACSCCCCLQRLTPLSNQRGPARCLNLLCRRAAAPPLPPRLPATTTSRGRRPLICPPCCWTAASCTWACRCVWEPALYQLVSSTECGWARPSCCCGPPAALHIVAAVLNVRRHARRSGRPSALLPRTAPWVVLAWQPCCT